MLIAQIPMSSFSFHSIENSAQPFEQLAILPNGSQINNASPRLNCQSHQDSDFEVEVASLSSMIAIKKNLTGNQGKCIFLKSKTTKIHKVNQELLSRNSFFVNLRMDLLSQQKTGEKQPRFHLCGSLATGDHVHQRLEEGACVAWFQLRMVS